MNSKINFDNFDLIQCPYCETRLQIKKRFTTSPTRSLYAVFTCQCDEFPMFDGILYLIKDESKRNQRVVKLLELGRWNFALKELLNERKKLVWLYVLLFNLKKLKLQFRLININRFFMLLSTLDPNSRDWYKYCLSRNKRVVFKICESTLSCLKHRGLTVDCGSGLGHFLKLLNQKHTPNFNIGIDYSFKLLFLSRVFVVDSQNLLICSDLNYSFPLASHKVSTLFFNDCFMYLFHPLNILRQSKRVVISKGLVVINHIHLSNTYNLGAGYSFDITLLKNLLKQCQWYAYASSDYLLFQKIKTRHSTEYFRITNWIPDKKTRSISLILWNKRSNKRKIIVKKSKIKLESVDYTEEEDFAEKGE